MGQLHCLHFG